MLIRPVWCEFILRISWIFKPILQLWGEGRRFFIFPCLLFIIWRNWSKKMACKIAFEPEYERKKGHWIDPACARRSVRLMWICKKSKSQKTGGRLYEVREKNTEPANGLPCCIAPKIAHGHEVIPIKWEIQKMISIHTVWSLCFLEFSSIFPPGIFWCSL